MAAFEARHPERFLQFGISERNMIGAAAGLATTGLIPYVCTFACFSGILALREHPHRPRVSEAAGPGAGTHAGIAMGFFGTSHHATEDIAALRAVAGLTVLSPSDAVSTEALLRATVDHEGPIYFRIGRGREEPVYPTAPRTRLDGPTVVRNGDDVLLVATGSWWERGRGRRRLAARGIAATVLDVHTLKPFAGEAIAERRGDTRQRRVVEEHNVEGGLGTMDAEALAARGDDARPQARPARRVRPRRPADAPVPLLRPGRRTASPPSPGARSIAPPGRPCRCGPNRTVPP